MCVCVCVCVCARMALCEHLQQSVGEVQDDGAAGSEPSTKVREPNTLINGTLSWQRERERERGSGMNK